MEKAEIPLIPIKTDDLKSYKDEITTYLKMVSWLPDRRSSKKSEIDLTFLVRAGKAMNIEDTDELSILKNAVRISEDRTILTNTTNVVLNTIRTGYTLGKHLAALYEKASGLELLQQKNKDGSLHQSELPEYHDKLQTQSGVFLFTASYYIDTFLRDVRADEVSAISIDFGGIPEVSLTRPTKAIQCSLYYYAAYLERSGVIKTDLHLLKITLLYFERLIEEIRFRKDSFKYLEPFTNQHYKLEHSEFLIQGFETNFSSSAVGVSFNRTRMEDIVANKQAKHMFKRFAERLLCFDFASQKNPMLELGGLPSITMADGKPGTGKSMLIAAVATVLQEKCEMLGYPFLFWPLPENIISTYQGGSAERAIEWFKPMRDPNKIIFAPVDDAENNLEERTRRGVSAGVREFIGVFLRNTEGAYAINHGNRLISLFTNIPDQVDKAVLSRIQVRVSMDGAKEFEDFVDQDYIWWRKYAKLDGAFVNDQDVEGYKFMSAQAEMKSLNEMYSSEMEIENDRLEDIFKKASKKHQLGSHEFFGNFYEEILDAYPFFSSRDLRNIQKAVDARITDFDLPEIWWEKPDEFFLKDYGTKMNMLKELMKSNMGSLSFEDIRVREALNYIQTAVRINETGINRQINQTADEMFIQKKAAEKLRDKND